MCSFLAPLVARHQKRARSPSRPYACRHVKPTQWGPLLQPPAAPAATGLRLASGCCLVFLTHPGAAADVTALQTQLLRSYDLLGIHPRGVNATPRLTCKSSTPELATDLTSAGRNAPGNQRSPPRNMRAEAQACQSNDAARYISTDATARDMDLLRGLLGDSQISSVGYSYGTWLGAWLRAPVPQRVDHMVLDSNADVTANHLDLTNTSHIPATHSSMTLLPARLATPLPCGWAVLPTKCVPPWQH